MKALGPSGEFILKNVPFLYFTLSFFLTQFFCKLEIWLCNVFKRRVTNRRRNKNKINNGSQRGFVVVVLGFFL